VLEPDLIVVIVPAALGAVGLQAGQRLVGGQGVGRHLFGVVDAAGDDRTVRVALEEVDDHLLADPRVEYHAPVLAGPVLRDADPAGAVLVLFSLAVPEELDFHPAVLVGVDFFALGADDHGSLRAVDARAGGAALGAEDDRVRDAGERVVV